MNIVPTTNIICRSYKVQTTEEDMKFCPSPMGYIPLLAPSFSCASTNSCYNDMDNINNQYSLYFGWISLIKWNSKQNYQKDKLNSYLQNRSEVDIDGENSYIFGMVSHFCIRFLFGHRKNENERKKNFCNSKEGEECESCFQGWEKWKKLKGRRVLLKYLTNHGARLWGDSLKHVTINLA